MADRSGIEWCDSTFNPWIGCTRVSPACDHCYAAVSTPARALGVEWGAGSPRRRTSEANWNLPRRWNRELFGECDSCGARVTYKAGDTRHYGCPEGRLKPARRRVFCASLADVFDNEVDPQWRIDLLHLIAETPNLDWLLLTKRIGNAEALLDDALGAMSHGLTRWEDVPWPNVWLGATICNQREADRDIPKLLQTPAAVRFVSMEPLLGPVNLRWYLRANVWEGGRPIRGGDYGHGTRLDWVIVGGESGGGARPMRLEWARLLRDWCRIAGVPFLFKQWGEWVPSGQFEPVPVSDLEAIGAQLSVPGPSYLRLGKKRAGRELDGTLHNGYPRGRR